MNKSQLVSKIALSSCISKVVVNKVLNVITESVIKSLKNGDHVSLMGFGTFVVKVRPSRVVKNPKNGEDIFVEASKVPIFRAGKKLKDSVNYKIL